MTLTKNSQIRVKRERCPYCHDAIPFGEAPTVCPACHALHHEDCFREHGRCAGCAASLRSPDLSAVPEVEPPEEAQSRWLGAVPCGLCTAAGLLLSYDAPSWRASAVLTFFFALIGLLISLAMMPSKKPAAPA